jgi:hypothetical protein
VNRPGACADPVAGLSTQAATGIRRSGSVLAFSLLITFLLIGQVWVNHHVMFDHIRSADRTVLFLNTLLLMDIAFLPFAASVLAAAFRTGHGQRTAVVFHGMMFLLAAILFNVIWGYAHHDHRLGTTLDAGGTSHQPALPARPRLDRHRNPAGRPAPRPRHGRYYWLPIRGWIAGATPRRHAGGQA